MDEINLCELLLLRSLAIDVVKAKAATEDLGIEWKDNDTICMESLLAVYFSSAFEITDNIDYIKDKFIQYHQQYYQSSDGSYLFSVNKHIHNKSESIANQIKFLKDCLDDNLNRPFPGPHNFPLCRDFYVKGDTCPQCPLYIHYQEKVCKNPTTTSYWGEMLLIFLDFEKCCEKNGKFEKAVKRSILTLQMIENKC